MLHETTKRTGTVPLGAAFLAAQALFLLWSSGCAHERPAMEERDSPLGSGMEDIETNEPAGETEAMDPGRSDLAQPSLSVTPRMQRDEPPACRSLADDGRLHRAALLEVLERGLGAWLQGVRVKAQMQNGKFSGWRIESLHLANPCYARIDLRPGDIVTSVNGKSVARDAQAFEVWNALKTAPAIEVDYWRGGHKQRLMVAIVD